uniref:Uncharacterized protein n=1 Tax=Tetraselmis sp. GSL018 TaxID=582737 RepID=A0A061S6Y7_9CHLO
MLLDFFPTGLGKNFHHTCWLSWRTPKCMKVVCIRSKSQLSKKLCKNLTRSSFMESDIERLRDAAELAPVRFLSRVSKLAVSDAFACNQPRSALGFSQSEITTGQNTDAGTALNLNERIGKVRTQQNAVTFT